jgi:CIC family chloride channel protein
MDSDVASPGGLLPERRTSRRLRRRMRTRVRLAGRGLRQFARTDDLWLLVLSAFIGVASGLLVAAMVDGSRQLHHVLFGVSEGEVSGAAFVDPMRSVSIPILGGLVIGLIGLAVARRGRGNIVDPIEANALHGGRLSLPDSLILVLQTLMSNGFGASVGMEAGFTQAGSALASVLGRSSRVRRSDLRTLVGCGAAAAIAAAFDAPLTGAFYAFELVIAAYTIGTLAPVAVASICAVGMMRLISLPASLQVGYAGSLSWSDYVLVVVMGILCAALGILLMRGVALAEGAFRRSRIPAWLRPAVGGAIVGVLALVTPAVLSSGHGALRVGFSAFYTASFLAALIVLKAVASAISIGSGFRGGLFFASLFLGAMLGKLVAIGWMVAFGLQTPTVVIGIIGMSAMATAVLGGPLTMSFLALETTGSLPLTVAVLAASVVSSVTVRRTFGYSFATWRFHLRGESIRSAADVGWIRDLNVGRLMRRDVRTASSSLAVYEFRREFPLGSTQRVVLIDAAGRYAGIILVPDAHRDDVTFATVAELARFPTDILLPQMNVREAAAAFAASESEELAVVDSRQSMKVIGLLTEQHALRRYNDELDRRSRELSGA